MKNLYAEVDFALIAHAKWGLDTGGHYARPDVFKFFVNQVPNKFIGEV